MDLFKELRYEANSTMLTDLGAKRGITEEKIKGTYVRNPLINEQSLKVFSVNYIVDFVKKYFD